MKTISDIKKELSDLEELWNIPDSEKRAYEQKHIDKAVERMKFLRQCVMAVERGATQWSLEKQLEGLLIQVKTIDDGFGTWINRHDNIGTNKSEKVLRTKYNKEMKLSEVESKIEFVKYLLA